MARRGMRFWALQGPGWLLLIYLVYAQGIPAIHYDWGVAVGDLLVYIPLLALGLIGAMIGAHWGRVVLAAALGITVYWPLVSLAAVWDARGAPGWTLTGEAAYWVILPPIALWAAWGLVALVRAGAGGARQA